MLYIQMLPEKLMIDSELRYSLQQVFEGFKSGPQSLSDIWLKYNHVWQGVGWQKSQLSLWLSCQSGISKQDESSDLYGLDNKEEQNSQNETTNLGEIILDIVAAAKRPVAIKLVIAQLPSHIVATEGMLKSAALDHPKLTMIGPLIKLA